MSEAPARDMATRAARVLLYSDNSTTRQDVRRAVGGRVGTQGVALEWTEVATPTVAVEEAKAGGYDLLVLDGEAGKFSGIGIARTVEDEMDGPPPILLLLARPQDEWLAAWSGAGRTLAYPADPFEFAQTVAEMLSADA
ncbi:MAG: hypothetical protein LBJ08_11745 [Bifidobacteriaceae bacterium]|jgi:DNA-binding response OmpR family regulator|nr:hypothetical protein [Bifidobacteriaceae bacterium]